MVEHTEFKDKILRELDKEKCRLINLNDFSAEVMERIYELDHKFSLRLIELEVL